MGSGSRATVPLEPLSRLGFHLGAAFQIRDDLLSVTGGAAHGKDALGDIREGKRTLMLIHLMRNLDAGETARVTGYLGRPRAARSMKETHWILDLMRSRGSLDQARKVTKQLAGAALYDFESVYTFVRSDGRWRIASAVFNQIPRLLACLRARREG